MFDKSSYIPVQLWRMTSNVYIKLPALQAQAQMSAAGKRLDNTQGRHSKYDLRDILCMRKS